MFWVSRKKYENICNCFQEMSKKYWELNETYKIGNAIIETQQNTIKRLEIKNAELIKLNDEYFQRAQSAIRRNEIKKDRNGCYRDPSGKFASPAQKELKYKGPIVTE